MVDFALYRSASLHQDAVVRTTLSIDQDLYDIAVAIARDRRQSLSAVINELLRDGLTATSEEPVHVSKGGFPSFRTRRRVTLDDVRSLEDEM
jgi:hypothetical protein